MIRFTLKITRVVFLSFFLWVSATADEKESSYVMNFKQVPAAEFIQFVNKISKEHFLFKQDDLDFDITLIPEKPLTEKKIVDFLCEQLRVHGFSITQTTGGFLTVTLLENKEKKENNPASKKTTSEEKAKLGGLHYKVQHRKGEDIEAVVKELVADSSKVPSDLSRHLETLRSLQIIKSTNTVIGSGPPDSVVAVVEFLQSIDAPLKQVCVEVLAIDVDARRSSDFGVKWSGEMGYKKGVNPGDNNSSNANGISSLVANIFEKGLDVKLIGDLLFYKGNIFTSLSSLMSALMEDHKTSIVLYQLLTGSDNQKAVFFAGQNVPFVGSVIETVGGGVADRVVSSVEYRDVGTELIITPYVGENNCVRVAVEERITEIVPAHLQKTYGTSQLKASGIQTTKNSLNTSVYVPNNCFCILSGTSRSLTSSHKSSTPCLGGLPWISNLFGNTQKNNEKRNFVLFLRPMIIEDMEDFKKIMDVKGEELRIDAPEGSLDKVLDSIKRN